MAYKDNEKAVLLETVFQRMVDGESLRSVCRDEAMPSMTTMMRWIGEDEGIREQYACACEARADAIFDEILEIADASGNDTIDIDIGFDEDGEIDPIKTTKTNHENIQRSKLRVDARKWAVSKMNPKKYGDRIVNVNQNIDVSKYDDMSDEEIQAEIDRLRGK